MIVALNFRAGKGNVLPVKRGIRLVKCGGLLRLSAEDLDGLLNLRVDALQHLRGVKRHDDVGLHLGILQIATIEEAEALTANNTGLTLSIAADYGGRWDILQAANKLIAEGVSEITEDALAKHLMLGDAPEPDLFIRTGGETRISNFLLWQMAYAELYFTDTLWPDFDSKALDDAVASFQKRERRFGRTSEQLPVEQQRG